jgi:hypothetical protein
MLAPGFFGPGEIAPVTRAGLSSLQGVCHMTPLCRHAEMIQSPAIKKELRLGYRHDVV